MNIAQEKIDLISQIALLNDEDLIKALKNLIAFRLKKEKENDIDFWDTLSDKQKERIDASARSIEAGNKTLHADVMDEFRKKLHK